MGNDIVDVSGLTKSLELNYQQKLIVDMLNQSPKGQVDVEFCRSKLKSVVPAFTYGFQKKLKELEEMGVILIGYDVDGKRVIRMGNPKDLKNLADGDSANKPPSKERRVSFTGVQKEDIKDAIINIIKSHLPRKSSLQFIYSGIQKVYKDAGPWHIRNMLNELNESGILAVERNINEAGRPAVYSIRGGNSPVENKQAPVKVKEDNSVSVDLKPKEYERIASVLKGVGYDGSPKEWIRDKIIEIVLYLSDNRMLLDEIFLDKNHWDKYQWLKNNLEGGADISTTITGLIDDYIDKLYSKEYIYGRFMDMVKDTESGDVLVAVRNALDDKLKKIVDGGQSSGDQLYAADSE
jgi:hypothetical protein